MAGINRKRTAKEYDVKFYVTWNQIRGAFDKKRTGYQRVDFLIMKAVQSDWQLLMQSV
jgi:hypothetical protein